MCYKTGQVYLLLTGELPPVPETMRKAPRAHGANTPSLDLDG